MSLPNFLLVVLFTAGFSLCTGCESTSTKDESTTQLHLRPPVMTWDHCDVDINPLGITHDETTNLTIEYTGTANGLIVQTLFVHNGTYFLYGQDGTTKIGELDSGKPFSIVLSWANPATSNIVHVVGPTTQFDFACQGTYNENERRTSPCFEEQDPAYNEFVRMRVRFRGLTTFFVIKP